MDSPADPIRPRDPPRDRRLACPSAASISLDRSLGLSRAAASLISSCARGRPSSRLHLYVCVCVGALHCCCCCPAGYIESLSRSHAACMHSLHPLSLAFNLLAMPSIYERASSSLTYAIPSTPPSYTDPSIHVPIPSIACFTVLASSLSLSPASISRPHRRMISDPYVVSLNCFCTITCGPACPYPALGWALPCRC